MMKPRRTRSAKLRRRQQVQSSDGNFFEKVTAPGDGDVDRDDELYTIKNLSINGDKRQIEALYVEALYTITHKLGQGDVEESQESLYKYVRNAFQGDAALHTALMEKAKQNKPPSVLLNILLLEAKDLIAKDVNGFSDPFAMMGVVPGTRKENQPMTETAHPEKDEQEAKSPRMLHGKKDGLMHRFGGSFRRKVNKKGKPQDTCTIPAKLIKASSVQKKTLNPKWSERFQFAVEDVHRDQFHIDIWDHDDEEQSVLDAVSSLNQITGGLKGIGRYFKEVTQSARANSDDCTDDFLGCINLKLETIPPEGLEQWFTLQPRSEKSKDPDPCKELLKLLNIVNVQCSRFLHYAAVIREVARIDYSQLTLNTFDRLLTEYLTSELMSEKKMDLKSQMRISAAQDPPNDDDLIDLMRIHMAFIELRNYRLANRVRVRDESEWYAIFNKGIKKFLEVAKDKALARVNLSCQLDMPISTSSNDMRHSSSHIDICHIIEQFTVFWERVDINDAGLKIEYTSLLVDVICEIVTVYCQKIISGLEAEGFTQELQTFIPSQLLHLLCAAINNCEQVRRSLNITEKLHMDDMSLAYERDASRLNGNHLRKSEIENRLEQCENFICSEIDRIVGLLTGRLLPQMKKHVFHLAWSPTAQLVEDSLKPLTDMLDIELSAVHKNLLHRNFLRVMSAQVSIVVKLLRECVSENVGMEPSFYHRLFEAWHVLVEFFHAGGKGLSMEALETNPDHMKLVKILSLNQTATEQLIEKYYKDLLKQQNEVSECKYGILNVRAYYNGNAQTLVLDVIGAKQIIALDSNGLSDPFVVIEIIPKFRYPAVPVVKTKVVSKSLNPIFDETFEFHIPPNPPSTAMLHFTVMDHDYLRSNDFAGEAFLELNDVPGFGATGGSTLRQFNLILIQPVSNTKDVLDVLNSRKEDKDAVEFLRSISTVY
ncbi:hypothetical protein L3Y34_010887 [Caenorhabditis briggsae]|uniref:Uncharacterized protein n=1 Tax=Caenorhabditis briggsae TaxID=6238 RepID=A0AAE8ZSX7_CAEBR|nr:hypothetical protein L3Y34_010887 [Caenorhabditis briggsae]